MAGNDKMSPRKAMAMGKAAKKAGVKKKAKAKKMNRGGVLKMNLGGPAKKAGVKKPVVMRRGGSGKKKT